MKENKVFIQPLHKVIVALFMTVLCLGLEIAFVLYNRNKELNISYYVVFCMLLWPTIFSCIHFFVFLEFAIINEKGIIVKNPFKKIIELEWREINDIREEKILSSRHDSFMCYVLRIEKQSEIIITHRNSLSNNAIIMIANSKTRKLIEKYSGKFDEYHPLSNFKGKTRIR